MRKPTKMALISLAKKMVDNELYINTRGTGDFMNEAIKLHLQSDSTVHQNTIRRHERELEEFCRGEMLSKHPLKKDIIIPKQFDDDVDEDEYDTFEDEEFYWACGDMVDHDTIIRRGIELQLKRMDEVDRMSLDDDDFFSKENIERIQEEARKERDFEIQKQQSMSAQIANLVVKTTPVKNYSMFIEDEDGLRIIRGEYKGLYTHEIDSQRWIGCSVGWSKYQLRLNEDLGVERKGALTDDDKNVFLDIISGKF